MSEFRLTLSSNHDELAQAVVLPWLRLRTLLAWQSPRPTVVLVPTRAEAFYWKEKLAAAGHPILGILFWTPSDARKFLLPRTGVNLQETTAQPDVELFARQAAETLLKSVDPTDLVATRFCQAVQISPAGFLAQFEMLSAAGWNPSLHGSQLEREMAVQFSTHLETFNLQTQTQSHSRMRQRLESSADQPLITDLLITGFNATHWPIWDLLAACSLAATHSTVALSAPIHFAQGPDQAWITAWESWAGTSYEVGTGESDTELDEKAPFAKLAESFETGTTTPTPPNNSLSLIVGPDLPTHARAIVTQTLLWLARENCSRIGLIFPAAGPLSLAIAEQFRALNIPHNDGTGFLSPSTFSEPSWLAWLDLQENPSAANFLAWYLACQNEARRETGLSATEAHDPDALELDLRTGERFQPDSIDGRSEPTAEEVAEFLNKALDRLLIDSLPVLQSYMAQSKNLRELRLVEVLRDRIQLPPETTQRRYIELTYRALDVHESLNKCLPVWAARHITSAEKEDEPAMSLATYLKWLRAITDRRTRQRDSIGNEYYGKVHLLIAAQMSGQSWSHLLLADMNRGVWPKEPEPAAFLSSQALENLNKTGRSLNRNRPEDEVGHGYCLAPMDRPELSFRDLCHALENTSAALCLTASLKQGARVSAPNELFSHVYQVLNGEALNDVQFQTLAGEMSQLWGSRRTAIWESEPPPKPILANTAPAPLVSTATPPLGQEVFATSYAFRVRRDVGQQSTPFEYCFASPPEVPIQMSCSQWDNALQHPASIWLQRIVGCRPSPEISSHWEKTAGTWLHRWTKRALHGFRESGDFTTQPATDSAKAILETLLTKLDSAKEADMERLLSWCQSSLTLLPHWWLQVRNQAVSQTEQILATLALSLSEWEPFPECVVPHGVLATASPLAPPSLRLSGRMDCLLIKRELPSALSPEPTPQDASENQGFHLPNLAQREVWVIDFKTGSSSKLSIRSLDDPGRKGWQTVLYGWALRHLKAAHVTVSLLRPGESDAKLNLNDVLLQTRLFNRLDLMHRQGRFGQPPGTSQDFGFSPSLPIATLPISTAILKAKWQMMLSGENSSSSV